MAKVTKKAKTELHDRVVVPGERLFKSDDDHEAGKGTFVQQGIIFSSSLGFLKLSRANEEEKEKVEVVRSTTSNIVPCAGDVVTVRIVSVHPRFCKCSIICIRHTVLQEPFHGMIRKEDVRAADKDNVKLYRCFRPNDIVLARVISLGDAHSYILSTAENELGVVIAHSEAGAVMVPVSWIEMQCPKTFNKEPRKVAKVVSESGAVLAQQ